MAPVLWMWSQTPDLVLYGRRHCLGHGDNTVWNFQELSLGGITINYISSTMTLYLNFLSTKAFSKASNLPYDGCLPTVPPYITARWPAPHQA